MLGVDNKMGFFIWMHYFSEVQVVHLKTTWSVLISSAAGATWTHAQPVEEIEALLNTLKQGFVCFKQNLIEKMRSLYWKGKKWKGCNNSDKRAGKFDRKWKRMIWKGTSTITTTAIKILAAMADSCLVVCFIAWKEGFCELLWFILSCWKFLDLTSQSYLGKAEFVQMVLTMARLPDGSFLNNWYYGFAKFLPFKKVSVGMKVLALEKKVQITALTACSRDNKNHIKNSLLANKNF